MAREWLIGDLHIGHRNILKYRQEFSSIEEHDSLLAENINKCVGKRDNLYLFGDIFFTMESLSFLDKLKYTDNIMYVIGNHCFKDGKDLSILKALLDKVNIKKVIGLHSRKGYWYSHAPVHELELRNRKCLHGHTHSVVIPDDRYFNVSCENVGYSPVSMDRIREEAEYGRSRGWYLGE